MEKFTFMGFAVLGILSMFGSADAAAGKPAVGEVAPDLTVRDQEGREVTLSQFRGKWLLIYFYPKDDTPGCTKQACSIRDGYSKFGKANIVVYGASSQDAESHKKFKARYNLPFDLIVDRDGKLGDALGIEKYPLVGIYKRQTVLIDPQGKVSLRMDDVDPATHADEILKHVEGKQ
jgi:peroxiredoxin Q/BCP